jgi:hypothetical protein
MYKCLCISSVRINLHLYIIKHTSEHRLRHTQTRYSLKQYVQTMASFLLPTMVKLITVKNKFLSNNDKIIDQINKFTQKGSSKPGKFDNFFSLVSMKFPYFPHLSFNNHVNFWNQSCFWPILYFMHMEPRCYWNMINRVLNSKFDSKYVDCIFFNIVQQDASITIPSGYAVNTETNIR